jgi:hypothetical protein
MLVESARPAYPDLDGIAGNVRKLKRGRSAMRYAGVLSLIGVLVVLSPARAEKPEAVRAIDLKDVGFPETKIGMPSKPVILKGVADLEIYPKTVAEKIAAQVDFSKEILVLFFWEGSGADLLSVSGVNPEKTMVTFVYKPGRTKDLRKHVRLFAVPKDASVKVLLAP